MEILPIDLSKLRNAEYIQYGLDILNINNINNAATLMIEPQQVAYRSKIQQMEDVYKQATSSRLTPVIEEMDTQRDQHLVGITSVINGSVHHPNAAKREAAFRLQNFLASYGAASTIGMQSLQAQTTTINNIVNDLNVNANLVSAAATLDLTDWIQELKTVNTNFNNTYMERTQELAGANPDKLKLLRLEANELYYKLREMLSAHSTINGDIDPWHKTINEWNALSRQYNDMLATRAGRMADDDDVIPPPVV